MNHYNRCNEYRQGWLLFKGLLGLNLVLFKLLYVWVQLCLILHS